MMSTFTPSHFTLLYLAEVMADNMRNAICAATQTSKFPTRVALLYISLFCGQVSNYFNLSLFRNFSFNVRHTLILLIMSSAINSWRRAFETFVLSYRLPRLKTFQFVIQAAATQNLNAYKLTLDGVLLTLGFLTPAMYSPLLTLSSLWWSLQNENEF